MIYANWLCKERNAAFQSEIKQFKISDAAGAIKLEYLNITVIQHPQLNTAARSIRYSDLGFDSAQNRLMLIKSYFAGKENPANYYGIDTISLTKVGLISQNKIDNKNERCFYDLIRQIFDL